MIQPPDNSPSKLNLPTHWVDELAQLFTQWAPEFEVWAYGSRVTGHCHEASDLDLVLIHPYHPQTKHCEHWLELREALMECNVPIPIDLMDWSRIPEEFHRQIDKQKCKLFSPSHF